MARTRFIKPGFFDNDTLASLSPHARLLFIGLWTIADRDGKLDDRPARIKARLFPYEDVNVEEMLAALNENNFILRYRVEEDDYISVVNFKKHQSPHPKEQRSIIPDPTPCNGDSETSHRHVIGKPIVSNGISGTCKASYPLILQSLSSLPTESVVVETKPAKRMELDEHWTAFFAEWTTAGFPRWSDADWAEARMVWNPLDFEQKLAAIQGLRARANAMEDSARKSLPKNYLQKRMWERGVMQSQRNDSGYQHPGGLAR